MPDLDLQDLARRVKTSQIWRSVFRHGYQDTPRNRALMVLANVFLHLHPVKIRPAALRITYTWGLGGISFYLFLVLTLTGVLLMFYYRPTVEHAYLDMKDLRYVVPFGDPLRNMHRWAAHLMVFAVMLHMASVFYRGAYKPPREYNWVIGVLLLLVTFLLSFTGYLLPWDQLAIWAVTVGTNMAAATPILGAEGPLAIVGPESDARFLLLGAKAVGQSALLRFYVLHCVLLPLVFAIFVSVHFWRVRKDEFSAMPLPPKAERRQGVGVEEWLRANPQAREEKVFVWPNLVGREFVATLVVTAVLLAWSLIAHAPLEELADPNKTPNPSKAPWYFAGLQELLVYFDPWIAGVVLPTAILIGLTAIPYLDVNPRGVGYYNVRDRKFAVSLFTFGLTLWFVLIAIGYYLRGPGWEWYWPWQPWDIHRVTPQGPLTNLPNWAGVPLLVAFFGACVAVPRLVWKPFARALGPIRYTVTMLLAGGMFFVVLKIILRLLFKVKYVVSFPGINLNI